MIFSHGHPEYRKNAPADTKSLDFSMYMSFSIKSVQSPLECGDFYFPVLMFEDLPHDSYRINITSIDAEHDISMREVYGLDKTLRE